MCVCECVCVGGVLYTLWMPSVFALCSFSTALTHYAQQLYLSSISIKTCCVNNSITELYNIQHVKHLY